ncbi:gelsolin-like protein 1 [Anneissia japonica]|uniref:gelsolin-like protein 1 n=1 Tax=Anneissia japonica TaxID=1529436 RepID=UPI00142556C9|nr:gelsolin-like protein 1 [Anneissia japonica]
MPTGFVKAKEYDWKDSNLALFGSDTEKNVKKASAETEPAWSGAGQKVGLQVWRIVKFKVKHWPKEEYGKFYNGDSYILLNTYKDPEGDELLHDLHFWIGTDSTQDEYGTAAYKTVELDTLLDDKPVQHREVMDYESDLFKSYFKAIEYCPLNKHCLNPDDVFILDLGLQIYQWNGENANKDEKFKAMQYVAGLKSERGKAESSTLEGDRVSSDHPFYKALSDDPLDAAKDESDTESKPAMFRLQDRGKLHFEQVADGSLPKNKLDSGDVFLLDNVKEMYVWIGKEADAAEKKNAFAYAHNYLNKTKHPFIPISCVSEGREPKAFFDTLS